MDDDGFICIERWTSPHPCSLFPSTTFILFYLFNLSFLFILLCSTSLCLPIFFYLQTQMANLDAQVFYCSDTTLSISNGSKHINENKIECIKSVWRSISRWQSLFYLSEQCCVSFIMCKCYRFWEMNDTKPCICW